MEISIIIILSAVIVLQYLRNRKIVAFKNKTIELMHKRINELIDSEWSWIESAKKLQHKANRWDSECERQRVKNRKYRERNKAEKMTAKEIAEKYFGVEVESDYGYKGFICGYDENCIIIGFNNTQGWRKSNFGKHILKKHKTYWYMHISYILPQLKNK